MPDKLTEAFQRAMSGPLARFGTMTNLADRLGYSPMYVRQVMNGLKPASNQFLEKLEEFTGVRVGRDGTMLVAADNRSAEPTTSGKGPLPGVGRIGLVMAVVDAVNALTPEANDLLQTLIVFRTGGEAVSAGRLIDAIGDITQLKDTLKDDQS